MERWTFVYLAPSLHLQIPFAPIEEPTHKTEEPTHKTEKEPTHKIEEPTHKMKVAELEAHENLEQYSIQLISAAIFFDSDTTTGENCVLTCVTTREPAVSDSCISIPGLLYSTANNAEQWSGRQVS